MLELNKPLLLQALSNKFGFVVIDAVYETELLQGGDVGEVNKISGEAVTADAGMVFSLVFKNQKKWERHGDPECWRREYEIYRHGLDKKILGKTLMFPQCYLLNESSDATQIWMEYIEGKTSEKDLHAPELSLAAQKLGELQAEFHRTGQHNLPFLRKYPAVCSSFDLWYGRVKDLLGSGIDGLPEDIGLILNSYAGKADEIFASFSKLPVTLCQGDFYHDNLIFRESSAGTNIYVIDWDCAGYGYMGEDAVDLLLESFVYSDRDVALLPEYKQRIISSYLRGVQSGGVEFSMNDDLVRDIFALAWGFRIVDHYLYYLQNKDEQARMRCLAIIQAMLLGG